MNLAFMDWKKFFFSLAAIFFAGGLIYAGKDARPALLQNAFTSLAETGETKNIFSKKNLAPAPALQAQTYLVRILESKESLLEKNAEEPVPPASITKLLTVFTAAELLGLQDLILFSEKAKSAGEKTSAVQAGEHLAFQDAAKIALIESANDAAHALAEAGGRALGGLSYEAALTLFVQRMNQVSERLGMEHSHFQNPTGLHGENHVMSARDIVRLTERIWNTKREIFSWSRAVETRVVSYERNEYRLKNTNELLREFPGILGSKTGFTNEAGETLTFLYPVRPNHTAVIVLLGSEDRFGDGRKIIEWLESFAKYE